MAENKNIPEIRFDGFIDAWEQRKLGELCTEFKSGDFISAQEIEVSGPYPVYGGNGLRGYTDRYNHDGEYALIGRQGALCGNMNFSFGKAYFTEHAVAVKADKFNDTRFLFYCFGNMNLGQYSGQSAQPGLAVGNLVELKTLVPSKPEQEKISATLTHLDALITLHQRKYERLKNVKKSMLEKMFPHDGANIPEIRFDGFTEAWEQRQFSELYERVSEKNDLTYGKDKIISVANMYFKPDSYITDPEYLRTYNVFHLGDIAFEGNKSKNFAHGRFVENTIGNGIVSHVFDVFRPITEYDLLFWKYAINNERIMGSVLVRCTKASTMMTNLVANDFLQESILVPTVEEQQKIGAFLDQLDNLITLHQRKYEKLKQIKKSMLEKMFV